MVSDVHIVVNKHTPYAVQAFERIGKVTALDTSEITPQTVKDADILIVRSETKVNEKLLEQSRVRFVGTVTIGTDHVDEEYLAGRGIQFASAPGCNSNSVSEYITAALLELAEIHEMSLQNKTIGIVGIGNVGSKVFRKVEALGMNVLLHDPPLQRKGSAYVLRDIEDLMEADFLTLHVPLTRSGPDATVHLFDEKRLRRMKRGAIILNSARGGVIETGALKKVLREGLIASAVLDVWEKEPVIDIELLDLVRLGTQHIAGHSLDGKVNALRMNYEAVCRFLSIPAGNTIEASVLYPESHEISVREISGSKEQILKKVIKQCYDITQDDELLRGIKSMPQQEQGKYFARLRTEYRVRREFYNTVLSVPEGQQSLRDVFSRLGFKMKDAA